MNGIVRVLRIGKLTKLVKIVKLLRLLKFLKNDNRVQTITRDSMQLNVVIERLVFLVLMTTLCVHIITCMWLFAAVMMDKDEIGIEYETWLTQNDYSEYSNTRLYLISLYYTIIISYGNVFAYNDFEMLYSIGVMMLGGLFMA